MDKIKNVFSGNGGDEEEGGIMADISNGTTLSWGTRIKGFLACFILGVLLSILGSIMIFFFNYVAFGIFFSMGTIISLVSTCFLMGPWKQLKKMMAPTRLIATIVVLISIVLTLMAGCWWKNGILVILFVIIQYLALAWYSISYIPYARDAVQKCVCACLE